MIITISREFGSGGRELGKRLSDAFRIPYYDKEIIALIAKENYHLCVNTTGVEIKRIAPNVASYIDEWFKR